jgi:hypothetical protein
MVDSLGMSDDPFLVCGNLHETATESNRCSLEAGHAGSHSVSVPLDAAPTSLVKMWAAADGDELEAAARQFLLAVGRLGAAIDGLGESRVAGYLAGAGVPGAAESLTARLRRIAPTTSG